MLLRPPIRCADAAMKLEIGMLVRNWGAPLSGLNCDAILELARPLRVKV